MKGKVVAEQAIINLDAFKECSLETTLHHIRRYQFVTNCLRPDDSVLDICCGSGYGTSIMGSVAKNVRGIDKNTAAIAFAKEKYPGCKFQAQNILLYDFPYRHNVITMFECLDHLPKNSGLEMLNKVRQSCQNILFLSLPQDQKLGTNPYHLAKWTDTELKEELEKYFKRVVLFGQSWASGQIYFPYEERRSITVFMAVK